MAKSKTRLLMQKQARSHGGEFGGSAAQICFVPSQIFLFPENLF